MVDIKNVDLARYRTCLRQRGVDAQAIKRVLELNDQRKEYIQQVEEMRAQRNKASQYVGEVRPSASELVTIRAKMKKLTKQLKSKEKEMETIQERLNLISASLPNLYHESVPEGAGAEDNQYIREWGTKPQIPFSPKRHEVLGEQLGVLDFKTAAHVAGARFVTYWGRGAELERALGQFMLDMHVQKHGYLETIPPYIVNSGALFGTGQFPKFVEDVFALQGTDYHLIPTAEVPVTNYFGGEILKESDLPIALTALTPCFRAEAGTYGQDTKGLVRLHQFHKVELVQLVHPESSYECLEQITSQAEAVLQDLDLHYRVVSLCAGDLGFSAAKTYDLEVWLPGQNAYREISSCSNFEDFQARRVPLRFRPQDRGKPRFVHTLNGSGLAIERTIVAILENYQQEDGSILIPKALQPYMRGQTKLTPAKPSFLSA